MSYEEIDRSTYGSDVFTGGAEGRYAKAKKTPETSTKTGEKKKRAPKIPSSIADDSSEHPYENGYTDETVKIKKKSRKALENGGTQNDDEPSQSVLSVDGEAASKPKKKRAPKVESNIENIDPVPTIEVEPVKKKKTKAPKSPATEEDFQIMDSSTITELEPSTEMTPKVKKSKKRKTPKTSTDPTTDTFDGTQMSSYSEYTNSELNDGDISYDASAPNPSEGEQFIVEPERSEYEIAITNAYSDLASKVNFSQFVGDDQWTITHLPKSARGEPKSRIRKMLPGGKDNKPDGKSAGGRSTNQKSGFLNRIRTGVSTLVSDENNLIFGEQPKYEQVYFQEEEDNVDTDDLHRYAQKLRELEDADKEVNPEFLVIRNGKPVYAVHEADADGKMTLSARKPIYDRFGDQKPDDEPTEKKTLLARLRIPFGRNKDKDGKGSNSPKSSVSGTPDSNGKRRARKAANKTADDDMGTSVNGEPLID